MLSISAAIVLLFLLPVTFANHQLNVYRRFCHPHHSPNVFCSRDYNKIYVFKGMRTSLETAEAICHNEFHGAVGKGTLILIKDCPEYDMVQELLGSYVKSNLRLYDSLKNGEDLDIWTGTYDIPTERSVEEGDNQDLSLTCKSRSLEESSGNEFNLTAEFIPYDNKNEGQKLFPMCEYQFPKDFTFPPTHDWENRRHFRDIIEEMRSSKNDLDPVEAADEINRSIKSKIEVSAEDISASIDYFKTLHNQMMMSLVTGKSDEGHAVNFTRSVVESFSLLLDMDDPWSQMEPSNRTQTALSMIDRVHKLSYTIGCIMTNLTTSINDSNIQLETIRVEDGVLSPNFLFPSNHNPSHHFSAGIQFTNSVYVQPNSCKKPVVSGVVYRKVADHIMGHYLASVIDDTKKMNSHLISFSLSDEKRVDLNQSRVRVSLPHQTPLTFGDHPECVFWDAAGQSWSGQNCWIVEGESSRQKTVCECDHLTNFAVLMDIKGREGNNQVKSVMTTVCCLISMVCLSLTIVSIVTIKSLRNRRSIITCNLSVCLLIVNGSVVWGFDQVESTTTCRVISAVTLFALLSAFFWMLMEGYLLYQMIILVFQSVGYIGHVTLYCFGYLPSLLIVGIFIASTGFDGLYDPHHNYFCWISSRKYPTRIWVLAGPAFTIITINGVILIKSFVAAVNSRKARRSPVTIPSATDDHKAKMDVLRRWFKGWTSLFILVGLTWVVGLVYIHKSVYWFSYVFIVLNSLQGTFIFLFEIVLNSKTRTTILRTIRPHVRSLLTSASVTFSSTSTKKMSTSSDRPLPTLKSKKSTSSTTSNASSSGVSSASGSSRSPPIPRCYMESSLCSSPSIVSNPTGNDDSPHHVFHHDHEVAKVILEKSMSISSTASTTSKDKTVKSMM